MDLFTESEVKRARKIINKAALPHKRIRNEILTDEVMARIDKQTGQTNDRRYMAYRLEALVNAEDSL